MTLPGAEVSAPAFCRAPSANSSASSRSMSAAVREAPACRRAVSTFTLGKPSAPVADTPAGRLDAEFGPPPRGCALASTAEWEVGDEAPTSVSEPEQAATDRSISPAAAARIASRPYAT